MQGQDIRTWPLELGPHGTLTIEADMASVSLVRVAADAEPVAELPEGALEWFDVRADNRDGNARLQIHLREPRLTPGRLLEWFTTPRRGGLVVRVPDGVNVAIHADAGKVVVEELALGRLKIEANAGKISLRRVSGALQLRASAGKIEGGVSGALDVKADAGAVNLQVAALDAGEHHIHADVGSVQVELPPGAPIRVEAGGSLGKVRNEFVSSPDAAAVLHVTTNLGKVVVEEASATSWAPIRSATTAVAVKAPPDQELERVLKMVEEGTLSAGDAADILRAIEGR